MYHGISASQFTKSPAGYGYWLIKYADKAGKIKSAYTSDSQLVDSVFKDFPLKKDLILMRKLVNKK